MIEDEKDNEGLRPLGPAGHSAPDDSFDAAGDFQPGQVIPETEYTVRSRIGRGGHATVYECENSIGRVVAVKVIQRHLARRPELLVGMVDEARRQVRLRHPKIVEVYRAGVTSGPRPVAYIEMERLIGGNGRQLLVNKKRLQVVHALDMVIDVCDALAVAHGKGVVHQDLKPDNIFVHFDDDSGKASTKLLDFGVSRIVGQAYNQFEGTLPYAPPEQLTGGDVTPLSDLYALGVVLFEFLTGRRPFDDAEEKDRQEEELSSTSSEGPFCRNLVDAKMNRVAPRVSDFSEEVPLPRELEDIIAALLERESARRILPPDPRVATSENGEPKPATASELAKRLRAIRALRGLQKATLTTQELLVGALRNNAADGGGTLRLQPVPMAVVAAPSPAPPDRAPAFAQRSMPSPHLGATLPIPVRTGGQGVDASPNAEPNASHAESGPRAASVSPPVAAHTSVLRAPEILDIGPPAPGTIVGTLDPVIERRASSTETGDEGAAPARTRTPRRIAIGSVMVATPILLAVVVIGALRVAHKSGRSAAPMLGSSAGLRVDTPAVSTTAPPSLNRPLDPAPSSAPNASSLAVDSPARSVPAAPAPAHSARAAPAHPGTHGHSVKDDIAPEMDVSQKDAARAQHATKPAPSASAHAPSSDWLEK